MMCDEMNPSMIFFLWMINRLVGNDGDMIVVAHREWQRQVGEGSLDLHDAGDNQTSDTDYNWIYKWSESDDWTSRDADKN